MSETVWQRDRRIRNAALTMGQTFYLCTLNQFIGKNCDAWPSQATLADRMNASTRSVRNWQTELETLGVIAVESGRGCKESNRYSLNLEALPVKERLNTEPRAAFKDEENPKCGTTFLINAETSASGIRNHLPTERTAKEQKKVQGVTFPAVLNSKQFQNVWAEWETHRREIKKKLTPSTVAKQLAKLATWGPEKAIQSIQNSISHGWQGLFDPCGRNDRT